MRRTEHKTDPWTDKEIDDAKTLDEKIFVYVKTYRHVSFAELGRVFPDHFKDGKFSMMFPGKKNKELNIMIWFGCSEEGIEAINKLVDDNKIVLNHSEMLVYLCGGCIPRTPIAVKPPKNGYKKLHWLPMTIDTIPYERTIIPKRRQVWKKP